MEIGSEFSALAGQLQTNTKLDCFLMDTDRVFTFSGRTAIETALRNISNKRNALLPAYCCQSMVDPFLAQGVSVDFYPVEARAGGLDIDLRIPDSCDVVLLCNYFGFSVDYPKEELARFRKRGGVIIEDITHSMFSQKNGGINSNYLVASLRKWGPVLDGGVCWSREKLDIKPDKDPDEEFLAMKWTAMVRKAMYLQGADIDKKEYLLLYSQSNKYLAENYENTRMSVASQQQMVGWDICRMRDVRRNNAKILYSGLKNVQDIRPMFPERAMDCPLFVPVLVDNGRRDDLRQYLISQEIYCPVHWPMPEGTGSNIYAQELSLVCDQRYSATDMQRMVNCIHDFMKRG